MYGDRPEEWWHEQQKSNARARYILGIDGEAKPADRDESDFSYSYYGMGEARTLQQYWEFAGETVPACRRGSSDLPNAAVAF